MPLDAKTIRYPQAANSPSVNSGFTFVSSLEENFFPPTETVRRYSFKTFKLEFKRNTSFVGKH